MENIALAFSGGGFRAAAYSMGCLSYLNRIQFQNQPLLQRVKFIASTSGGSITNLLYSSYTYQGRSFDDFYTLLNQKLNGDQLLKEAMTMLNDTKAWEIRSNKNINLINAFSLVYDKLLEEKDLGLFSDRTHQPHLEELCINATEFTNGLPFRFQTQNQENNTSGLIGNKYIFFTPTGIATAEKIKLADILAASSCFPSGFEPLVFPDDFANTEASKEALFNAISYHENAFTLNNYNNIDFFTNKNFDNAKQFGIMDGGITDNQAIDAFVKADERRKKQDRQFDLFMSCDVSSYLMDGYTLPSRTKKWYDFLTLNWIFTLSFLAGLWLPIASLLISNWQPWHYITTTLSGIFTFGWLGYLMLVLRNKIGKKKTADSWNTIIQKYQNTFYSLSLGSLKQMVTSRFKSVFILANDIYLKQIRRMYYDKLFNQDEYKDRVIQNTIYDLSRANFSDHDISTDAFHPSRLIIATAEKARTMGTTLWFDENHQAQQVKEAIIATGQFTTCYKLLKYIDKKEPSTMTPDWLHLKKQLEMDWELFCENPYFMNSMT